MLRNEFGIQRYFSSNDMHSQRENFDDKAENKENNFWGKQFFCYCCRKCRQRFYCVMSCSLWKTQVKKQQSSTVPNSPPFVRNLKHFQATTEYQVVHLYVGHIKTWICKANLPDLLQSLNTIFKKIQLKNVYKIGKIASMERYNYAWDIRRCRPVWVIFCHKERLVQKISIRRESSYCQFQRPTLK